MNELEWKWYAGSNEEQFHAGPFDTREMAIDALEGEGGYIIEAHKRPVPLAAFFEARDFLENAEEQAYDLANENGDPLFDVTTDQEIDLHKRVVEAITQWQAEHSLVFTPWAFSGHRNMERIDGEVEHTG